MSNTAGIRGLVVSGPTLSGQLRFNVGESATCRTLTKEYEAISGATGVAGRKEMHAPSFCEAEIIIDTTLDVGAIQAAGETLTVVAIKANGQTISWEPAWLSTAPEEDLIEGKTTLRFESSRDAVTSPIAAVS